MFLEMLGEMLGVIIMIGIPGILCAIFHYKTNK
jgi:hypothetical protein